MRKKILICIDSLACAGAEKSLVTLLSLLDYSKYSIDLKLFKQNGLLQEMIPKEVNILKEEKYDIFIKNNLLKSFGYSIKNRCFSMFIARIKFSVSLRVKTYSNSEKARIYWQKISPVIKKNEKQYDIAISYAQGVPTFYVAEKIKAKKKFAWVNVSYRLKEKDKKFQQEYYNLYNKIVAVSSSTKEIFLETFPCYEKKIEIIYDINDAKMINKMANVGKNYEDRFDGIKILTIGRLAEQKGYDIALKTCKILKENKINFKWYVLGVGPLEEEIKMYIKENKMEEYFILLGITSNPYSFIKNSDIYVQTSKFEGFGLAIAEARMLNIPIVTTEFDAVYNQMVQRKNGIVVDMNAEAVAKGIMELINNEELRISIIDYLKKEKKGSVEELDKFYELIESN